MSFNPNIDYFVKINGSEYTTKIKLDLVEVEQKGLVNCIKERIDGVESIDISYRKIHLTDYQSHIEKKEKRKNNYGYSGQKEKKYADKVNKYDSANESEYKVYTSDIHPTYPEYVVVKAINPHKAIIRALHSLKVFDFPEGWKNAYVIDLEGNNDNVVYHE